MDNYGKVYVYNLYNIVKLVSVIINIKTNRFLTQNQIKFLEDKDDL